MQNKSDHEKNPYDSKKHHDEENLPVGFKQAIEIARKFLGQYHSTVIPKTAFLHKKRWLVVLEIGLSIDDIMEVTVDAKTGQILGYTHYLE
jgi:uncharacterized membrane protein YkoI